MPPWAGAGPGRSRPPPGPAPTISPVTADPARPVAAPGSRGPTRMLELWRLWRAEREDPEPFYGRLAADLVADLERRHGPVADRRIADLGCGPGFYTRALRAAGAVAVPVEGELAELLLAGDPPPNAVIGDAGRLPLPAGSLDGIVCSNMLEHTPDPRAIFDEMGRVLRPGGWAYVSFTNWYSPWGGHEMSPYHYLGPALGPRVHERLHGKAFKHEVGVNLFPLHVHDVLRLLRDRSDLHLDAVEPRYWPWAAFVMRVPGVREVLAWNCVLRLTRRPA
jgi:SAM-dependent methyltransferase